MWDEMAERLGQMQRDLEKAKKGNKTAAQRVRSGSVAFAKLAKLFRKESLAAEKAELQRTSKSSKAKR